MKKIPNKERLSVYLDKELLDAIEKEANKNLRTQSGQVIYWVMKALKYTPKHKRGQIK